MSVENRRDSRNIFIRKIAEESLCRIICLRQFARQVEKVSFKAKGSGKSGLMAVSRPGQEVLERSACQMDAKKGDIVLRMEIGFPANGRTVNARELEKIFFDFLPECVKGSLYYRSLKKETVRRRQISPKIRNISGSS